jgi:hypothetical protein
MNARKDSKDKIASTKERIIMTGRLGKDSRDRTTRKGQLQQDSKDRTARKTARTGLTGLCRQYKQDRTTRTPQS